MFGRKKRPARDTSFGDADFMDTAQLRAAGLIGRPGIPLGDHTPPREQPHRLFYSGDQHLITLAPARTGKGTTAIIPTLLEHDASALVIDPKGQNAAVTRRARLGMHPGRVFVVNPFGLHKGPPWHLPMHRFNPLADIDQDSVEFTASMSALCEALIITEGKEPHFCDAARDLVSVILIDMKLREPDKATLPRMRAYLTQNDEDLKALLEHATQSEHPAVRQRAGRFLASTNEIKNVVSTAITQTSFLDDPAIAASLSASDFKLIDLKRQGMTVFLVLPSKYLVPYARWFRLFVVSALDALTSTHQSMQKPVLCVLDEFAALGRLDSVETAMGLSAGYGVQLWPILQDINQLRELYLKKADTFMANSGITQVFRTNDMETAKHFSERAGNYTQHSSGLNYRTDESDLDQSSDAGPSEGFNRNFTPGPRPLLTPQDFLGMPNDRQVLFKSGSKYPAWAARHPYFIGNRYRDSSGRPRYDPDPYHPNSNPWGAP